MDEAFELKRLAKSLLLNFVELNGVLGLNPASAGDKLADVRTLFINMHHNINKWRPHQTREALITLMQTQLERTQNEAKAAREVTESARRVLEGLASIDLPRGDPGGEPAGADGEPLDLALWTTGEKDEASRALARETWTAMDALFD